MRKLYFFITAVFAATVQFFRGSLVVVSDEVQDYRFDICKPCDAYATGSNTCMDCGCNLEIKIMLASEQCPRKKWLKRKQPNFWSNLFNR